MSRFLKSIGRRRFAIFAVAVAVLAIAAGGVWLQRRRASQQPILEQATAYDSPSKPITLEEALAIARRALNEIEHNVRDYSAIMIEATRIDNQPAETVMFAKIREKPLSVYLYFFSRQNDASVHGREVIYVEGRNDGKLLVHTPGLVASHFTLALDPRGWLAMGGQRHPVTDIGLANLCRQLIQRGESIPDPRQAQVREFEHARINARQCTLVQFAYPVDEPKIGGYLARVFVDKERHFPIRLEVYELPKDHSQGPQLIEAYTYLEIKLDNGYTDADFDPKNPQYKFP